MSRRGDRNVWAKAGLLLLALALLASLPSSSSSAQEGGGERTARDPLTGVTTFLGFDPHSPVSLAPSQSVAGRSATDLAASALIRFGPEFEITDPEQDLRLVRSPEHGTEGSVRYQQLYQGVPVLAGELLVNLNGHGQLRAIIGEISPDLAVDITPVVASGEAKDTAVAAVAKVEGVDAGALRVSDPSLWIFDERLLKPSNRPAILAWRVEVTPKQLGTFRYLVLIDAQRGQVATMFNQIDTALNRVNYDNSNNYMLGLPGGGPVRTEGGPASGIADVNNAYDYAGDTYNFYMSHHHRDSIDGVGMTLVSTTRYCPDLSHCPYANAFWNGAQMVYGAGFASADDVVGHELTHGVTENTSNLFYYYQSGAINESLSDVWGEFIDQTDGVGSDTASDKWLMGEDIPGGALRSMKDPTIYGDPDKMSSANYSTGAGDSGGVHSNSGINNKAAYLMTDGDSFNGKTVSGLGITKVAAIYYEVQTNLLTSGADYADLYEALYQGCLNLIGGSDGITAGDCTQVRNATDAVEMDDQPSPDFNTDAAYCPTGEVPLFTYFEDFESGVGAWTSGAITGTDHWTYPPTYGAYATSGDYSIYADDYPDEITDTYAAMTSGVVVPAGGYLHFAQAYGFENYGPGSTYDGGVLEYSSDGGAWTDASTLFEINGYNGTIDATWDNPLAGREAFVAESHGYISSRLDLSSLAGQSVRIRMRMGLELVRLRLGLVDR